MEIGKMRQRITLQKSSSDVDENGNHCLVWKDVYSCFSYANHLSGKEYWAAAQVNAQEEVSFVVRYCKEVAELNSKEYRIVFREQVYNITLVDNVQYKNQILKLRCTLEKG